MSPKLSTVDDYINSAPEAARKNLKGIRSILKKAAPKAEETLKWGTPVFIQNRILFSFAAYKSFINFMPTGQSLKPFKEELEKFKTGKDTISFPHDKPLPKGLIQKIAKHRLKDVLENDAKWMY